MNALRPRAVIGAAQKWMASLDGKDPGYEHHLLEALWLYQNHNVVNEPLLKQILRSTDFHARAAATRVLCYWRDRIDDPKACDGVPTDGSLANAVGKRSPDALAVNALILMEPWGALFDRDGLTSVDMPRLPAASRERRRTWYT